MQDLNEDDVDEGAAFGGITGALLGLLAGPAGVVAGSLAGAATGGAVGGSFHDSFREADIQAIKNGLEPRSSALVTVIEHKWVDEAIQTLDQLGAQVVRHELSNAISDSIRAQRRARTGVRPRSGSKPQPNP